MADFSSLALKMQSPSKIHPKTIPKPSKNQQKTIQKPSKDQQKTIEKPSKNSSFFLFYLFRHESHGSHDLYPSQVKGEAPSHRGSALMTKRKPPNF
jgi:hypothetical protein